MRPGQHFIGVKVSDHSVAQLAGKLSRGELLLNMRPFVARIRSDVPALAGNIALTYGEFDTLAHDQFADFHIEVSLEKGLRRWIRPMARFYYDGKPAFLPLPANQAFPMVEWGLNWCVAAHAHQYLIIHAAVLERDGRALIMPAPSGSGKSTLCAGLAMRGWRLLSDELALYDFNTGLVHGMARPINLKNASIGVIRNFAPDAVLTDPVADTIKGTVALMRPPAGSVARAAEPARPAWIVLPRYVAGSHACMSANSRAETFILLAEQSFNYDIQGLRGFNAIGDLIDQASCYRFSYSDLDEAADVFDRLHAGSLA